MTSCKVSPVPFRDVAPGSESQDGRSDLAVASCLLCCQEQPKYVAKGRCGHVEVCWVCAVRLRALLQDLRCPVCTAELPDVALVTNSIVETRTGNSGLPLREQRFGIICASSEIRVEVEQLFDYTCHYSTCGKYSGSSFTTFADLKTHLLDFHNRQFCETCLISRNVFLCEQLLYDPEDVKRHHQEGDGNYTMGRTLPPIPRHAYCKFCRRTLFSQEDLLAHMHKRHHICRLCERIGRRGQFYCDFSYLSLHYQEQHHVCLHEDCKRGSYHLAAFESQDDLQIHELTKHRLESSSGGCKRSSQRARKQGVRLQLQIGTASYRDEQEERLRCPGTTRVPGGQDRVATQVATASQGDNSHVVFMWTRGQPIVRQEEGEATGKASGDTASNSEKEREEYRYPARPQKCGPWARRRAVAASGSSAVAAHGQDRGNSSLPAASEHSDQAVCSADEPLVCSISSFGDGTCEVADAPRSKPELSKVVTLDKSAVLVLAEALRKIMELGLHSAAEMDTKDHMERVGLFKKQLEASLGVAQLEEFRYCSLVLQRSQTKVQASVDAHDFAKCLVNVFCMGADESGDELTSATLLSELVLLVPSNALRCALQQELVSLHDTETTELANPKQTTLPTEQPCVAQVATVPNRKGPFARRREAAAAKLKQAEISMHQPA